MVYSYTMDVLYRLQWAYVSIFFCAIVYVFGLTIPSEWKIYYDIETNKTIEAMTGENPRLQYYKYEQENETSNATHIVVEKRALRLGFGPVPCTCQSLTCGCCAGMNLESLNFNRRACLNMTYDPHEFSMTMDMLMNGEALMSQTFSGKNPPPACVPAPIPPILPNVDFCVRLFNIHTPTPGYNVFMCVDFETRIQRAPILVLHFDCIKMGQVGFEYHKPEDADDFNEDNDETVANEVYDEVTELTEVAEVTEVSEIAQITEVTEDTNSTSST